MRSAQFDKTQVRAHPTVVDDDIDLPIRVQSGLDDFGTVDDLRDAAMNAQDDIVRSTRTES